MMNPTPSPPAPPPWIALRWGAAGSMLMGTIYLSLFTLPILLALLPEATGSQLRTFMESDLQLTWAIAVGTGALGATLWLIGIYVLWKDPALSGWARVGWGVAMVLLIPLGSAFFLVSRYTHWSPPQKEEGGREWQA